MANSTDPGASGRSRRSAPLARLDETGRHVACGHCGRVIATIRSNHGHRYIAFALGWVWKDSRWAISPHEKKRLRYGHRPTLRGNFTPAVGLPREGWTGPRKNHGHLASMVRRADGILVGRLPAWAECPGCSKTSRLTCEDLRAEPFHRAGAIVRILEDGVSVPLKPPEPSYAHPEGVLYVDL